MKHIFIKYFLFFVAFSIPTLVHAQDPAIYNDYNIEGDVATAKSVSGPDRNGFYTLKLETFATGEFMSATKAIPSDIVLVLDYSSSMLMNGSATETRTRLYELKKAIGTFVDMIKDNNTNTLHLSGPDGNRIAFVIFAGKVYDENQPKTGNDIFYAKDLNEFIPVSDLTVNEITEPHPLGGNYDSKSVVYNIDNVDILSPRSQLSGPNNHAFGGRVGTIDIRDVNKGTNSGAAMQKAQGLVDANLSWIAANNKQRSTTVVFFTDGEPATGNTSYQNNFDNSYASTCLVAANGIKSSGVKVFTVGLFNSSEENRQIKTYMEYVSSDFVGKTWQTPTGPASGNTPYHQTNASKDWDGYDCDPGGNYGNYCFIVDNQSKLSQVFTSIAESSGGSTATIPAQTQVRDGVTNSFVVPGQSIFNDITVYTQTPKLDGTGWNPTHNTLTTVSADPDDVLTGRDAVDYIKEPNKVGLLIEDNKLTVLGFDYSKDDPDGNWVGWRDIEGDKNCYGRKLVIEFKVKADPNATGGDDTSTNTTDSGIYLPVFDDNGNIETYRKINSFEVQHADLPINLVIEKIGLRHGESATIQIYRAPQLVINGKVQYDPATGKPLPDEDHWENFSKVILTNKGADGQKVTKTLLCLFPEYVYKLEEDNWGWAYNLDTRSWDTSQKEKNPFQFVNTEKTGAVKHAEAVSINHFGQEDSDNRTEYYKSSKVEYFSNPTNY